MSSEHEPAAPDYRIATGFEVNVSIRTIIDGEYSLKDAALSDELQSAVRELISDARWADIRPTIT